MANENFFTAGIIPAELGTEIIDSTTFHFTAGLFPDDLTVITGNDEMQVYVTEVLYNSSAYPADPQPVFDLIDGAFREIDGLDYSFLSINRTEARFSGGSTREQLLIFMKNVTYNDLTFLTDTDSSTLRTNIKNKLDTLGAITYTDVEIRILREII